MLFSTFFNFLLLLSIFGYSYLQKVIFKKKDTSISNLDILYGILILFFLSLILHFFFPLKYFFFIVILFGFFSFIIAFYNKKINLNLFFYFLIIFFYIFISYYNGDNVDSPMYHLQIIKWLYNDKIALGLPNLEIRFGSNSLWFNFLSLLQFKYNNFNSIYLINILPFTILTYEILNYRHTISYIFLSLSLSFLFFFSYLHPFKNGIILNHLHNPELDTVAMVFFILSFYLFLKFFEKKNLKIFNLLVLSSVICFLIKLSYLGVLSFPFVILLLFYRKKIFKLLLDKTNILILIIITLWLIKNFLVSSCLIFPVSITCFNVGWSVGVEEVENYSNIIKGFARDTRERARYSDVEYMINSFNWFLPWFKDYAMNTALLKISFFISSISLLLLLIFNFFKKIQRISDNEKNIYIIIFLCLILNIIIWFQAPEIRFGWGMIITVACFPLSILIIHNKLSKKISPKIYQYLTIFVMIILIEKNKGNFNSQNLLSPYKKNFDYSKIEKIYNLNGRDFYQSLNWQCYDFREICVNSVKDKYKFKKKYGYLIFLNDSQK